MIKTPEELGDRLCDYCSPGPYDDYDDYDGICEGGYCDEAYENYLKENGLSYQTVKIANKVKVTIERE